MADSIEVRVERLDGKVNTLAATVEQHLKDDDKRWAENRETHKDLYQKVDRPSWAVTVVLSILSSSVVGLGVYVATH